MGEASLNVQNSTSQTHVSAASTNKSPATNDAFINLMQLASAHVSLQSFEEDTRNPNQYNYIEQESESSPKTKEKEQPTATTQSSQVVDSLKKSLSDYMTPLYPKTSDKSTELSTVIPVNNQMAALILSFLQNLPIAKGSKNTADTTLIKQLIRDIDVQIQAQKGKYQIQLSVPHDIFDLIKEHLPQLKEHLKKTVLADKDFELSIQATPLADSPFENQDIQSHYPRSSEVALEPKVLRQTHK